MVRRLAVAALAAVAAGGALAASPASPAAAGGGCHQPVLTDARTTVVDMRQMCFAPVVARVAEGDTVVFRNRDDLVHNVTGVGGAIGGGGQVAGGEELRHVFTSPGVYPYSCTLHPGMVGVVVVGDGVPAGGSAVPTAAPTALDAVPTAASASSGSGAGATLVWAGLGAAGALVVVGAGAAARRARRPEAS